MWKRKKIREYLKGREYLKKYFSSTLWHKKEDQGGERGGRGSRIVVCERNKTQISEYDFTLVCKSYGPGHWPILKKTKPYTKMLIKIEDPDPKSHCFCSKSLQS